jgi:hypothetical protein
LNRLLAILFSFSLLAANAQVLLPTAATAFEPEHNFNPAFIRSKGIRRITYEILDKKDFQVAVDNSLTETYEFNTDGSLTRHYYTVVARTIERQTTTITRHRKKIVRTTSEFVYDTVGTNYYYADGRLVLRRYHDGRGYFEARYYRYDSAGYLTKELRYRETSNSPVKSVFILGSQALMSEDSFQYKRYSSGQLKCTFLNNENRPYKERITNFDPTGLPVNIFESYTAASWILQEYKFTYKEGKLESATFVGNTGTPVRMQTSYEYDGGELFGEKRYRDSVLVKEISYVTDKTNALLNSFVIRDHIMKTMRIVKLRYDFGLVGRSEGRQF